MSSDSSTLGKRRKHNDLKISDKVSDGAAVQCEMNKTFATTRNKLFVVPFFLLTFYTVSTFHQHKKHDLHRLRTDNINSCELCDVVYDSPLSRRNSEFSRLTVPFFMKSLKID